MSETVNQSGDQPTGMDPRERQAAVSLAGIFSLRMLGLFMILPVFSLYAQRLEGATPTLTGLAIGAYGITQAILQIPYGLLSDRFGRKRLIALGLLIFAAGSVVAAMADTMVGVIMGRALQGAGAVAAVIMALAADLTREEQRTKIMAVIGMSIGLSFALALVLGPVLGSLVGISGIFWGTALAALIGIAVLYRFVPDPLVSSVHRDAEPVLAQFASVLRDTQLLRLDLGILTLHMILTASFVVLPVALRDVAGLDAAKHWHVYLPVLVLSVLAMVPMIIAAERFRKMKPVFIGAILLIGIAQFGLAELYATMPGIFAMLFLFYTGFNFLEASLPSLISRTAPPDAKGTAMGFYSSSQFAGAFLGGLVGGWLFGRSGIGAVFVFCGSAALAWAVIATSMASPRYLSTYLLPLRTVAEDQGPALERELGTIRGVEEAVVVVPEQLAYLKVDRKLLDREALKELGRVPD